MTCDEATVAAIDALETLAIPYMLVGSFSGNFYGIGRLNKNATFVIQLGTQSVSRIADRLGPQFRLDPKTTTMPTWHILEVVGLYFAIELFQLSDDPHDQERFRRRRRVKLFNREANIPTVEDVIITKLRWFLQRQRSTDRGDVRNIVAVQGNRIDWDYVYSWCDQNGTRALLDDIRRSIPPI
jgi:hypothetical protein